MSAKSNSQPKQQGKRRGDGGNSEIEEKEDEKVSFSSVVIEQQEDKNNKIGKNNSSDSGKQHQQQQEQEDYTINNGILEMKQSEKNLDGQTEDNAGNVNEIVKEKNEGKEEEHVEKDDEEAAATTPPVAQSQAQTSEAENTDQNGADTASEVSQVSRQDRDLRQVKESDPAPEPAMDPIRPPSPLPELPVNRASPSKRYSIELRKSQRSSVKRELTEEELRVKKWADEQRERQRRKEAEMQRRREELLLQENELLQRQREIEEAQQRERRERIEQKKQERLKQKQMREKLKELQMESELRLRNQKPLYVRMRERYEQNVVLPEIQNRQKMLKELREQVREFDLKELKEHEATVEERMRALQARREEEKAKFAEQLKKQKPTHFRGRGMELVLRMEKERREKELEEKRRRREYVQKMKEYGRVVSQKHKPKIDPQKRAELLARQEAEKRPSPLRRRSQPEGYVQLQGLPNGDQHSERRNSITANSVANSSPTRGLRSHSSPQRLAPLASKSPNLSPKRLSVMNGLHSSSVESKKDKSPTRDARDIGMSYLQQQRKYIDLEAAEAKRREEAARIAEQERLQRLKRKAEHLQRAAYLREDDMFRPIESKQDLEKQARVSSLLVESIRTKLDMLAEPQ